MLSLTSQVSLYRGAIYSKAFCMVYFVHADFYFEEDTNVKSECGRVLLQLVGKIGWQATSCDLKCSKQLEKIEADCT